MKTISDIKQIYARDNGFCEWSDILYGTDDPAEVDEHFDRLLVMVAREALKNAAENARTNKVGNSGSWHDAGVDKQSIINEKNIPEL